MFGDATESQFILNMPEGLFALKFAIWTMVVRTELRDKGPFLGATGVVKFDPATGKQFKKSSQTLSYTNYFADALIAEAEVDKNIVAIHAAMGGVTGLNYFMRRFPDRCFDVGIAEQHAVTFAAGLACEGIKPFCAIYSSFLQRAYDQVIHDVVLQKLPVRFEMDRAGLVGADGPTHCGEFDVTKNFQRRLLARCSS